MASVSKHNFHYLVTAAEQRGAYHHNLHGEFQDKFVTEDEAELQAITLSRLPALTVSGWAGRNHAIERPVVGVTRMAGYFITAEYQGGQEL